jgi:hypothetical protein
MNTYTWKINAVDCYTSKDGLEKVAYNVHWSFFATDGEHNASMIGVQSVGEPNLDNFVPFDQLTEEQVVSWITASMDVEQMQANLDKQIEDLVAPKVVTLQLNNANYYPDHFIGVPKDEQAAENVADEPIVE